MTPQNWHDINQLRLIQHVNILNQNQQPQANCFEASASLSSYEDLAAPLPYNNCRASASLVDQESAYDVEHNDGPCPVFNQECQETSISDNVAVTPPVAAEGKASPNSQEKDSQQHADKGSSSSKAKVKRPMNVFMVWAQLSRKKVADENAHLTNSEVSKLLGQMWRKMSEVDKEPFKKISDEINRQHKLAYPNYKYRPRRKVVKKCFLPVPNKSSEKKNNVFWDLTVINHPAMVVRPLSMCDTDLLRNVKTPYEAYKPALSWDCNNRASVYLTENDHMQMTAFYKPLKSSKLLDRPIFYPQKGPSNSNRRGSSNTYALNLHHHSLYPNLMAQYPQIITGALPPPHPGFATLSTAMNMQQQDPLVQIERSFHNLHRYGIPISDLEVRT